MAKRVKSGKLTGSDARYTFSAKLLQKGQTTAFTKGSPLFISVYTDNESSELTRMKSQFNVENGAVEEPEKSWISRISSRA